MFSTEYTTDSLQHPKQLLTPPSILPSLLKSEQDTNTSLQLLESHFSEQFKKVQDIHSLPSVSAIVSPILTNKTDTPSSNLEGRHQVGIDYGDALSNNQRSRNQEIIFIDTNVVDYNDLITQSISSAEVILLDSDKDGVTQITDVLEQRQNVSAIHIVSHGERAGLALGSTHLNLNSLENYSSQLEQWAKALTTDADILVYGCRVAEDNEGKTFIQQLSSLTSADIAASNDLTGSATLGGNWVLEENTGFIEASFGFRTSVIDSYGAILPTAFVDNGTKVDVVEVGGSWSQGSGYIQQTGTNKYLYAGETIAAGDFSITANLSLASINGTAASFEIDGDRFGFDSRSYQFFTEGDDWGAAQTYGLAANYITPGQRFDLQVVRQGADISFLINGTSIVTRTLTSGNLSNVGFRPWRNTMRLYDFELGDGVSNPPPANNPPAITSNGGGDAATLSVAENQTAVTTVQATDPDAGDILNYRVSGGVDAALFTIDSKNGVLRFSNAPDFENPRDANRDNIYQVQVEATDGRGGSDLQNLSIAITDVAEGSVINFVDNGTKVDVVEVGGSWSQGSGYIQQTGIDKYLYAGKSIAAGDFSISATLSLASISGTAASFEIDGDRFGFDSRTYRFFTEGDDWGAAQTYDLATNYITPGQTFQLQVNRTGADISFLINGNSIVTRTLTSGSLSNVGFRPWRNTLRLYDFEISGAVGGGGGENPAPNQFFDDDPIFVRGTGGYGAYRIPAMVRAGNGDLLAFAEGRVNGTSDFGNIDIVMRRSTDNGQTWQPLKKVVDNGSFTAGNPGIVVDRFNNNRLVMVYNTGTHSEQDIVKGLGAREVWVTTSDDNGATWSKPRNITTSVHRPNAPEINSAYTFADDWRWHAVLPGHGIQLNNGRLVFGANYKLGDDRSKAFSFYSDDGGQNWQLGGIAGYPGNENQIVQLSNGNLMMNARPHREFNELYRQVSISTDGGKSWSPFVSDKNLPDPRVQASILGWQPDGTYRLLFSNPASQTSRTNMTVRISYDDGQSWAYSRNVRPNLHGAYSDLVIQSDNKIGLLYETGDNADGNANDLDYISYARFNLAWLTQGNDLFA
ncbi:MAG: hypothetical protein Kow00121_63480 [Elainellaceae cyanobacterium]